MTGGGYPQGVPQGGYYPPPGGNPQGNFAQVPEATEERQNLISNNNNNKPANQDKPAENNENTYGDGDTSDDEMVKNHSVKLKALEEEEDPVDQSRRTKVKDAIWIFTNFVSWFGQLGLGNLGLASVGGYNRDSDIRTYLQAVSPGVNALAVVLVYWYYEIGDDGTEWRDYLLMAIVFGVSNIVVSFNIDFVKKIKTLAGEERENLNQMKRFFKTMAQMMGVNVTEKNINRIFNLNTYVLKKDQYSQGNVAQLTVTFMTVFGYLVGRNIFVDMKSPQLNCSDMNDLTTCIPESAWIKFGSFLGVSGGQLVGMRSTVGPLIEYILKNPDLDTCEVVAKAKKALGTAGKAYALVANKV